MERIIVGINHKVYEVEYSLREFKTWKTWNRIFLFYWNIGYTKFITNEGTEWQWVIEQFKNALEFVIPIIIPAKYHFVLHSPIQREVSNSVFYTFKVYRNDAYWTRVKKFTSAVWDAREHEWWINQRIDHCSRGQTTLLS